MLAINGLNQGKRYQLKATVIISIYEKFEYLELVLAGFENQSFKNFEIVIADDGSKQETVTKIERFASKFPVNIIHVWHEDKGFRKNKILNRALEIANSDYLIFIDGDCIPHKHFVKEHFVNKDYGTTLTGRRVNLSSGFTSRLTPQKIRDGYLENHFLQLSLDGIFGNTSYVEKGIYLKSGLLRRIANKKNRGLLGCNFSIHKKDFLDINGFDERYEAPSIGEDSDVQFRLELNNVKIKSLNNIAIQYHLYHKLLPRPGKNLVLFEKVKKEKKAFTEFGINQKSNIGLKG